MRQAREEMLQSQNENNLDEGKMSAAQIAKLKKAYEPMRGKKISMTSGQKLSSIMDKVDDDKQALIQLVKADIPFVSQLAVTRLITKHGMKGAEIRKMQEEVELDEAKYDLYHKDFSSAMQHSYKMAKKMYGITIDPKEIDDKVASGPRNPSEGKTNKYRLKGDKGAIQVQVYNKGGSKPFELNMYKEEVELDEGSVEFLDHDASDKDFVAMAKKYKLKIKSDGEDTVATGDPKNIEKLLQNMYGNDWKDMYSVKGGKYTEEEVKLDEKLDKEDEPTIKKVVKMLKKASGAHAGQAKDLEKAMTEEDEIDEGKMSQLHQLMKDGKSAKEIAKIMKLDVKTIQALMDEKSELEENLDGRTREYRQHRERLESMRLKRQEARHVDPADIDTSATDDDIKAADKNIMMQMRKSVSLRGQFPVEFLDKKKVKIPQKIAQAVIAKYNSLRKPMDKEKFQAKIAKSHRDLLMALKEGFASDAQRRAAFASGYKEKDKKKKESTLERMNKKLQEKKDG